MVSVTVSAAGRPSSLARGLPITVTIQNKDVESATVADVKAEILKKFPKVSRSSNLQGTLSSIYAFIVRHLAAKTIVERG